MTTIYQNIRSDEEIREEIEAIRRVRSELVADKAKAFRFMVAGGFITPDGKLPPEYGGK